MYLQFEGCCGSYSLLSRLDLFELWKNVLDFIFKANSSLLGEAFNIFQEVLKCYRFHGLVFALQ